MSKASQAAMGARKTNEIADVKSNFLDVDPNHSLFLRVRYRVRLILRIQHGGSLDVILSQPVRREDQEGWRRLRSVEERAGKQGGLES